MDLDVQGGPDVRFEVLEKRLGGLEDGLRPLFQCASDALEELADFPLVVRLSASERERRPERFAGLLQQLLERAPGLGGGAVNIPARESLARRRENARRAVPASYAALNRSSTM